MREAKHVHSSEFLASPRHCEFPSSYTNLSVHEKEGHLVITGGDGIHVIDDEGNRYIDGLSGLFCVSLGFSEERLVDAAIRQFRKLPFYHSFGHKANEPASSLRNG